MYFDGEADASLSIEVTADTTVRGNVLKHEYKLPQRDQTSARTNRSSIGKGFVSRYYQFKIKSEGVNYKLFDLEANVTKITRRI